jgi:hypothetical protein
MVTVSFHKPNALVDYGGGAPRCTQGGGALGSAVVWMIPSMME